MKVINCDWCGDKTEKYPSNITENNFCSRECYNSWNSEQKKGSGNPMWEDAKVEVTCDECGSSFERLEEYISENKFCSNECRLNWFGREFESPSPMYGEDNPAWSGGYDGYYGQNWNEERRNTLDAAEYKCELCGQSREEHYGEYGFDLDVHHRIPVRAFDNVEDANFQENLVVCCRNCHQSKLEQSPVPHNDIRAPA
jgi:hypothetical protein